MLILIRNRAECLISEASKQAVLQIMYEIVCKSTNTYNDGAKV